MTRDYLKILETSRIWSEFEKKADADQIHMVGNLVKHAMPMLDLVRDTFPTYTLHNHLHAENVLQLMDNLVGEQVTQISPLEGAILILSAYYHDIGMVFNQDEINNIKKENSFQEFQKKFPEAYLRLHENDGRIPIDVAEWYCRWIHPERVFQVLASLPDDKAQWKSVTLKEKLGIVCQSHGYDVSHLMSDEKFPTNFLGEADLKFCAILLRLADILDFDNTRSPEEIYDYLGIKQRNNKREEMSDVEWRKHLCSDGFKFPDNRESGYEIDFIAGPKDPAVEYDVKRFLDVIENELSVCASVLRHCSKKWQNFKVPFRINRSNIISHGYKYGEYRFTLEQIQILDLLMGENLYDNPYVFIRELIQNAIDTTRHRLYIEKNKGNSDFECQPIVVSHWYDDNNYQWIRVDDFGMGMDEDLIINFFLKIGVSYYRSPKFKADILRYSRHHAESEFVPISRFGIGILSCFISGDRVEVSTRHYCDPDDTNSIRLSLSGIRSFYTLQLEKDHYAAMLMPNAANEEEAFRKEYGTSIAVRLNPRKERTKFEIEKLLDQYVRCSPVPISFEGKFIGGDPSLIVEKPWLDGIIDERLSDDEIKKVEGAINYSFVDGLKAKIIPLNITKYSPTPSLKGQFIIGVLSVADTTSGYKGSELSKLMNELFYGRFRFQFDQQDDVPKITILEYNKPYFERIEISQHRLMDRLPDKIKDNVKYMLNDRFNWMSHNGVVVPTRLPDKNITSMSQYLELNDEIFGLYGIELGWMKGFLLLCDSLRPDVSLSREQIQKISWNVYSTISLAFSRALNAISDKNLPIESVDIFNHLLGRENFLLGTLLEDPYINMDDGWANEKIIKTDGGRLSLKEIKKEILAGGSVEVKNIPEINDILHNERFKSFTECCVAALLQTRIGLKLRLVEKPNDWRYFVEQSDTPTVHSGQNLFPPLFFVPYENSILLRKANYPLNQNHPFSQWLIENSPALFENYPGILQFIRNEISKSTRSRGRWKNITIEINSVLNRIRKLDKKISPSKDILLKESDFEEYIV